MSETPASNRDLDRRTRGLPAAWRRFVAIFVKEFIQLRRDRLTFATMIMIPVMQLLLFGYAINTDPKHLPAAILMRDDSAIARSALAAIRATDYFNLSQVVHGADEADKLILSNRAQFVIEIPENFGRDLVRGLRPALLVVADATDPTATGGAVNALTGAMQGALSRDLVGPWAGMAQKPPPFDLRVQRRYNPSGQTSLNIVPGLIGTILTLTMLIFTALSVTREIERGTMESLLAMPIAPAEIMFGKIAPYVVVGFAQMAIILLVARFLFAVPIEGSFPLFLALSMLFITANLSVGYTFSTIATNQLQAMQMSFFFFLPSMLLSGFMFPFEGMPVPAQWVAQIFPLTHFIRIVRGITLKGASYPEVALEVYWLAAILVVVVVATAARFSKKLG